MTAREAAASRTDLDKNIFILGLLLIRGFAAWFAHSNFSGNLTQLKERGAIAMKTCRIELGTLLFVIAFFPAAAQAQSGTFRLSAGLAPTNYSITLDIPAALNATAKSNYVAANLGATWVSSRGIFLDASGNKSLNAMHDLYETGGDGQQKFSRDSYTLTGGYIHVLSGGVSISGFGGYTYGKSIFYAPPGFGYTKDIFESKGIFVGAGAGVPALGGQFSGSLAIAGMKGSQKDDNGFDIDADTTIGFSLGGAYTYKLSQALGVTADLRYQQYKYDFGTEIPGYTVIEKITSLGVKLSYQF